MDAVLDWGLQVIHWIQIFRTPALDEAMQAITTMGDEQFYLLLFPLIFWTIDVGFAIRLGVAYLLSSYLNTVLKDLLVQPRPCDLEPALCISDADGYGLPSGHAQSAVMVWGMLGIQMRKGWFWAIAAVIMVLIGLSRVYLGVHFPSDVLAGWAIGVGLLVMYAGWGHRVEAYLKSLRLAVQIALVLAACLLLLAIHPVRDVASAMAALAGLGVGLPIFARYLRLDMGGSLWRRALRFGLGMAVLLALYLGLRSVFPGAGDPLFLPFRLLRYGLIGLWVGLGAPWLFRLVGLASAPPLLASSEKGGERP